ncbi:pyridine nucleotide-disulfide oxidoreductase, partial [Sodalis-like symbiont of Bactericera trigonica]
MDRLAAVGLGDPATGGSAAVKALREEGFTSKLVVVEREKQAPYDRTALSKFIPQGEMDINEVPFLL